MDIASSAMAGTSPVIGPNIAIGEGQSLDVVRIRLAVLKLPHQQRRLYHCALKTYT
jgi:hypothetical protein